MFVVVHNMRGLVNDCARVRRIRYVVFNKAMQMDAGRRFMSVNPTATVQTLHGCAFGIVLKRQGFIKNSKFVKQDQLTPFQFIW